MPDFSLEMEVGAGEGAIVAGVDEAGRGPWAGPVVAAAVVLDMARLPRDLAAGIDDSKALTRAEREEIFAALKPYATIAVARAEVEEIDSINILQASLLAMRRAVRRLPVAPACVLVDGNIRPRLPRRIAARTVVGGDALSLSIAAASIVAKVTRDRLMLWHARRHRGYGWETNVGYGTREHRLALDRLGLTPLHRRSFRPIWERLEPAQLTLDLNAETEEAPDGTVFDALSETTDSALTPRDS
ncbi:MAG: ribonuclease HII [Rhodospirillaceae bacterium]|nr:ribonuclease HII [Rhodospirillaceae bacterium]